jgi:hypothetical protein
VAHAEREVASAPGTLDRFDGELLCLLPRFLYLREAGVLRLNLDTYADRHGFPVVDGSEGNSV